MNFLDERLPDRFWSKCIPEPNSGCWLWIGYLDYRGYGRFHLDGVSAKTHRVTFLVANGAVPAKTEIDHLCRERGCCNPAHLEAVSHYENMMRGRCPAALLAAMTECKQGHAFNDNNTYTWTRPDGRVMRRCRLCRDSARKVS